MKIYLNRSPVHGPWGGGAKTINKLVDGLRAQGHLVTYSLEPNIDLLFCFDPRPAPTGVGYDRLVDYKRENPRTKIIQRVGDVGSHGKSYLTDILRLCVDLGCTDYFIFPSTWARDYIEFEGENCRVVPNAPMKEFYTHRRTDTSTTLPVKVVTHHWSPNMRKGYPLYQRFDEWCNSGDRYEFHYIGQLPTGFQFTNYQKPMSAEELSRELPRHDIYLTASEEEAGANHVLEGLAAGLPVVYKEDGGSIVEYCQDYGVSYEDFDEMIQSLENVTSALRRYSVTAQQYQATSDDVVNEYIEIIGLVTDEG